MLFQADPLRVSKLLNNEVLYEIPRNQRGYVWSVQNWRDLFDDIALVVDGASDSHFIGSIVLREEKGEKGESIKLDGLTIRTIIDGQQRIITLTLLLTAIMFSFRKRNMIDDFYGTKKYLIVNNIKNQSQVIIWSERHLSLTNLISSLFTVSDDTFSKISYMAYAKQCMASNTKDKNVIEAFNYFCERIAPYNNDDLLRLRNAVINIDYINIISDEDVYTIFEILNARGLDLEDHELLKNFIMRYYLPTDRRDSAKILWEEIENRLDAQIDNFLRHYATHRFNYSKEGKYSPSVYQTIRDSVGKHQVVDLLEDINRKSIYYDEIVNPSMSDSIEFTAFSFFKSKRVTVFRPLLLSLKSCLSQEKIDRPQYDKAIQFLYAFFICYKIIGQENSNMLTGTINKYSYLIENANGEHAAKEYVDACIEDICKKLPTKDIFVQNFKTIGYSKHWAPYQGSKNKERCQIILELIEAFNSRRDINIKVTIEHINPDAASIENSQIGNLIYLEEDLNKRCEDKDLLQKFDIYEQSVLACPRNFAKRYRTKEFIPSARTDYLAEYLYKTVLNIPKLQQT